MKSDGVIVIRDFFPDGVARHIEKLFKETQDWEYRYQRQEDKYRTTFYSEDPLHPGEDEVYSASFHRSNSLRNNEHILRYHEDIVAAIPEEIESSDVRCYNMGLGDHFRMHTDDYGADWNCIYYCTREWKWDWGGMLQMEDEVLFPHFNMLVILNNHKHLPHIVTPIASYGS